ncbi:urease accessory protein UreD [Corynebacterium pseudotuberculosis]|uniref:urease accessory protein UreD n=1 Tax=Corynebacterium pseudotuberculosis TaxID=1719 RepID=UPI00025044CF|nr:urease accessory protein UreD [Corynebacterium pseudotuberculosis]AFB73253.1 urease accessory protein UreD [Corynebacterium pseudotuberculosis 316]AMN70739.1 urease accessory protein UreD [Corynebacterium pseudotuberculosis]AMN72596.1 urease accessory protein UreD [Corynebacterium pseudotuberculosis]AMN74550.1 urease accessory protein UreD [Corynebacterium pseudotuberculosis]AMN76151.1 urease accessory protein UreD [Corynebacterium pseudotuberculosis]
MWSVTKGIFEHDPPHGEMGVLELGVGVSDGKSIAKTQYHTRALKIVRPHYLDDSGQVYYIVVNPGGGYVGGDAYRLKFEVESGASVLLTDQSAAKVYRTPDDFVVQNIEIKVDAGGVLEYVPDQLILYRDADFRQQITADVHPEGSLFISDVITPGWSPEGEKFLYRQAHIRSVVRMNGEVVLVDNLRINPLEAEFAQDADLMMGGKTHVATAICFDPSIDSDFIQELKECVSAHSAENPDVIAAISECDRPGFVLRGLGNRTEELMELILDVAHIVRSKTRGQGPINLRQY